MTNPLDPLAPFFENTPDAEKFAAIKTELRDILDRIPDGENVTRADVAAVCSTLEKVGKLSAKIRRDLTPKEPPKPSAGARIDALVRAEIERSGGKLSYTAALTRVVADPDNLALVLEYQGRGKTRRR